MHLAADLLAIHISVGPGDTLRLIHALRQYRFDVNWNRAIILVPRTALSRCAGLWTNNHVSTMVRDGDWQTIADGDVTWIAKAEDWPTIGEISWDGPDTKYGETTPWATLQADARLLLNQTSTIKHPVVHVFVEKEDRQILRQSTQFLDRRFSRLRIDRNKRMRRIKYEGPTRNKRETHPLLLACCIRFNSTRDPERDTPTWFCSLVERVAANLGVEVHFFTDPNNRELVGISPQSEVHQLKPTYVEQMNELAKCDVAIGVTSGGLDLAAAAGLPVMRVGEFHATGYVHNGIRFGDWGSSYNSFLARELNIGLGAESKKFEDISQFVVETSLSEFLEYAKSVRCHRPQHLLLQQNVAFRRDHLSEVVLLA